MVNGKTMENMSQETTNLKIQKIYVKFAAYWSYYTIIPSPLKIIAPFFDCRQNAITPANKT